MMRRKIYKEDEDNDIFTEGGQSLAKRKKDAPSKRKSSQTPNERIVK